MPKYAIVNNVNTARSRQADFDVHAAGCPALKKIPADDIDTVTAKNTDAAIAKNVDDLEGGGFERESAEMFSHRLHSCCKPARAKKNGATGPRYTEAQIMAGIKARRAGKPNAQVAKDAGVKSPSYFAKVLKEREASGERERKRAARKMKKS